MAESNRVSQRSREWNNSLVNSGKSESDNHCSRDYRAGLTQSACPAVSSCVSVRDGGHGVHAAVHQRRAGLRGRHAHADQAEGKRAACPHLSGGARWRGIRRESEQTDGNLSSPGEVAMAVLNEPMSWDSEEPGLSLQRGDGERKGDFHSGVSSVHIFILPHLFNSYQAPYCKIFPFYECRLWGLKWGSLLLKVTLLITDGNRGDLRLWGPPPIQPLFSGPPNVI